MAPLTLFLCGDVMTGRGIDQILPHPGDPQLHEPYVRHAATYLQLAEAAGGPLPRAVDFSYVWGDALTELARCRPAARIINLETAVTVSNDHWPDKAVHYRMQPRNIGCLAAAAVDCCVLANNHVLDWGYAGLEETLATLEQAGLACAGAGRSQAAAQAPAILPVPGGRLLVFGLGHAGSGIPPQWGAGADRPGVNLLPDLSAHTADAVAGAVRRHKRRGDIALVSIHWGGNWGYAVPAAQTAFAHRLIDGGVDVIHGHSSHHPRGIEIYRGKLILYGCGDFLNDYEGIRGHEEFRGDLTLMYLPRLDPADGTLRALRMVPLQIRRFRLHHATAADAAWLAATLTRAGPARVEVRADNALYLVVD